MPSPAAVSLGTVDYQLINGVRYYNFRIAQKGKMQGLLLTREKDIARNSGPSSASNVPSTEHLTPAQGLREALSRCDQAAIKEVLGITPAELQQGKLELEVQIETKNAEIAALARGKAIVGK